jgi:SAM-dependent methyltransferase
MSEISFNETTYLTLHKDVQLAVEQGIFRNGLEHYEKYGQAEGRLIRRFDANSHSIKDYSRLVRNLIATHPGNLDLAMAKAIGALTLEIYRETGDKQYQVLRRFGLQNGYAIYDLACGSGRTASALRRHDWNGEYRGADIIPDLVDYATRKNPGMQFFVHPDYSIFANDQTQDMIFAWSLFTHLQLEEIFLYAKDCYRALKPGGILVFSFLTLKDQGHRALFLTHVRGFSLLEFIDADDETTTPGGSFGQALAVFKK